MIKNSEYAFAGFVLPASLDNFLKQSKKIFLIQSKDDKVVSFEEFKRYKQMFPNAKEIVFKGKSHFNQNTFPKIIALIKSI